ncbi:MAG: nicotinamide riboside transporter PnuC [Crocinitomicaceae bacterium]
MEEIGFWEGFFNGVLGTSLLEWIGVLAGVVYVILASYRSIWCWLFAFISSSLYVYLCFQYDLFIESGLQLFYVAMAVVGWISWKNEEPKDSSQVLDAKDDQSNKVNIKVWPIRIHVINVFASGAVAFVLGWIFDVYTTQANPYMDAFTTVYSLLATFMVTRRVLENWVYWIVIDAVSILLYYDRGLYLSVALYALFTVLALIGLIAWWKEYNTQKA